MQEERRNLKEFKEVIYNIKIKYHYNQKEIALKCNYDYSYFNRIFKGKVPLNDEVVYRVEQLLKN